MKKYIALLLALIITASTLAACAAGVPTGSSSHVPSSSSVASAPPSSVAVSSTAQSSSVSVVSSMPVSSAFVPNQGSVLISETETHSTYSVTFTTFFSSQNQNINPSPISHVTYQITIPKPLSIDHMQILKESGEKLAQLDAITVLADNETFSDLFFQTQFDISYKSDSLILPNGKKAYFGISENNYERYVYIFHYALPISSKVAAIFRFYIFSPPDEYDATNDHTIFLEIMNSVKCIS